MQVTIVGTGYVGLPTGLSLAYLGHNVTCLDTNQERVEQLKTGVCPFYEPGLKELWELVEERVSFTTSCASAIRDADIIVIAVGTPADETGAPDLSYYWQAVTSAIPHLGSKPTVIVNKSTVPIGTAKHLKETLAKKLLVPTSVMVVSSPEFLSQGKAISDSLYPERIVVGSEDMQAVAKMQELYQRLLDQDFQAPAFLPRPAGFVKTTFVPCDATSAEMIKYASNAFLALKISYINEMAKLAESAGADIQAVAAGVGLDSRIGNRFLQAGIGWGGSCFGKDTQALLHMASDHGLSMPIVSAARQVNYSRRQLTVDRLEQQLGTLAGKAIGILGLSFKPGTDDLRDAPSLDIIRELAKRGAGVTVHDPAALDRAKAELEGTGVKFISKAGDVFQGAHAVLLLTEWVDYLELPFSQLLTSMQAPIIFDGRNYLDRDLLRNLGYIYIGVGR